MSVRIVHTADLHLDSAFSSLPPEQASARRRLQRAVLYKIAETVRAERADVLLMSGDIFDSSFTYKETDEAFLDALGSIDAHVFIAPGNHDPFDGQGAYSKLALPENVHVFATESITYVDLPELNCRVWGAGFMAPECRSLLDGFAPEQNGMIQIMALHADTEGGVYDPISRRQIAASGLDYLALGHIHAFSGICREGGTFYAYPGCPEGRGFDELGQKGVIAGTVDRGSCALRFVPLDGVRYDILKVDVTGADPYTCAVNAMAGRSRMGFYRLELTGQTAQKPDTAAIERALSGEYMGMSVYDSTRVYADMWQLAGEDSLKGEFLSIMKGRLETAEPSQREQIALAVQFAIAAMDNYDIPEMGLE